MLLAVLYLWRYYHEKVSVHLAEYLSSLYNLSVVTLSSLVCQCFKGTCCSHLEGKSELCWEVGMLYRHKGKGNGNGILE